MQSLLAAAFLMSGFSKSTQPMEALSVMMPYTQDLQELFVRFIGISEFLGAVGLLVPALTKIQPRFTIFAALGLAFVMANAMVFHAFRGEFFAIPINFTLFSMAAFVAYGRWKLVPFVNKN